MPMVDHLEKEGLLRRIDAKRTIDEVYQVQCDQIGRILDNCLLWVGF
jgi:hypothetical protein